MIPYCGDTAVAPHPLSDSQTDSQSVIGSATVPLLERALASHGAL
jgi:hypothetical protein